MGAHHPVHGGCGRRFPSLDAAPRLVCRHPCRGNTHHSTRHPQFPQATLPSRNQRHQPGSHYSRSGFSRRRRGQRRRPCRTGTLHRPARSFGAVTSVKLGNAWLGHVSSEHPLRIRVQQGWWKAAAVASENQGRPKQNCSPPAPVALPQTPGIRTAQHGGSCALFRLYVPLISETLRT